jgi:predicted transcriptional regulator
MSAYTELKEKFIADTNRSKRTFDRALENLMGTGAIKKTKAGKYVLV